MKNMRIRFTIFALGIFFVVSCFALQEKDVSKGTPIASYDMLSKRVDSFVLKNASIKEAISKLREQGLRVCFEEVKEADDKEVLISLDIQDKTVENILNEIVMRTSQYIWKRYENLIIIFPKSGSVLNWTVPLLKAENRSIIDLIARDDILELKKHNIIFFYRGFAQPLDAQITVDLQEKPVVVMEGLNILINSQPLLCWALYVNPRGKLILTVHFASERSLG